MLNPGNDRVDYGTILTPSPGYELDFAVGTTYSLDLDAFVGASLALGLSEETDSELTENPVCLLEALRKTGDRTALFCESGQIHVPSKVTPLYILLEKSVFSVKTARQKGYSFYPSFHPKFWLIRYQDGQHRKLYRIIALSRNLTFDRSWDVVCSLDGHAQQETTEKNEPVCDFLRFLIRHLPSDTNGRKKAKAMRELIRELPNVRFETDGKIFQDFEFIPNGIKKADGTPYLFDQMPLFRDFFHEILIISPFLSPEVIRNFNNRNEPSRIENARYMLITREMSLRRLKQRDAGRFKLYTMREEIIDGEEIISGDASAARQQDIHAKVYMIRRNTDSDLYLGSMNASLNAVFFNVEFMIRLKSKNRYLNMDRLTESLFGKEPEDNPFQEAQLNPDETADEKEPTDLLQRVIKEISRGKNRASVTPSDEGTYSISLTLAEFDPKGYQVSVRPLLSEKTEEAGNLTIFSGLSEIQLSEFYVFTVSDGDTAVSRVLIIPTEGLPEERDRQVVTSIVNNQDCFCRYIAFLLEDDSILSLLETAQGTGEWNSPQREAHALPALYEKMLQTAARAPEKLRGIDYLIKSIDGDGIIPEGFRELYETFRRTVKLRD